MSEYSFNKGWNELKGRDRAAAKRDLMAALNITTNAAFCDRRRGDVEPRISQVTIIEDVFAKYGVEAKDVWGDE